jgi:hypothetical protein
MLKKCFILLILTSFIHGRTSAQDTIIKRNKEQIIAKIIEISPTEVKYKRADLPDGPTYTEGKSGISVIKYSNGSIDDFNPVIKKTETPVTPVVPEAPQNLSPRYIIVLNDATQLRGTIVKENKTEVVFLDDHIGEKTINRKKITSITNEYGSDTWIFTLTDGSIITGKIIRKTEAETIIQTLNLGKITIPSPQIQSMVQFDEGTVSKEGNFWFKNPNCTRYLFAPSAIPLRKGEGYYHNFYGAGNGMNYGVTNNFSMGGGILGPMGIFITPKVGFKVNDFTYVAAGALIGNGFFPINGNNFGLGIGYAVFTIGNYDHNITGGVGYGFVNSRGETNWQERPMYVINGMTRLGRKFALVSENWVVPVQGDPFGRGFLEESHYETFFSYACRIMNEKSTVDIGFVNTPGLIDKGWYIGIPYIDFVIRFGKYKEEKGSNKRF